MRTVHSPEELIYSVPHEDGSQPRRTGVQLTFYIRIVAFAPKINLDQPVYEYGGSADHHYIRYMRYKALSYEYWTD